MATRSPQYVYQLLLIACICIATCNSKSNIPKIAIVGAGIGGTSAAYFANKAFSGNVKIDIFEANKVGGRVASIKIGDHLYNAGGSIIHPKNMYMTFFTTILGLEKQKPDGGPFALVGKEGLIFESSKWTAVTLAKLLWRYGLDIYKLQSWIENDLMKNFEKIYGLQDEGYAYTTLEDLLKVMDENFINMTKVTLKELMLKSGFSELFIDELVTGGLRSNYGQTASIHGFVGAVSAAGMDTGLWSVKGGNHQVPEKLLKASGANLVQQQVTAISLQKDSDGSVSFELRYHAPDGKEEEAREYDFIILAKPRTAKSDPIVFEDFPRVIEVPDMPFHTTVAMFVEGVPNATFFGVNQEDFPTTVLTTSPEIVYNSMGLQTAGENDGNGKKQVYKVFLNKVPTNDLIERMFSNRTDLRLVTWKAYPEYKANMELPPFVLYDHLFYVNAVETAASAMEMSAIGGRNAALLAYNNWHGLLDKIDEVPGHTDHEDKKTEL